MAGEDAVSLAAKAWQVKVAKVRVRSYGTRSSSLYRPEERGIFSRSPGRIVLGRGRPLTARIWATVVPWRNAIRYRVSPLLTR